MIPVRRSTSSYEGEASLMIVWQDECSSSSSGGSGQMRIDAARHDFPFNTFDVHLHNLPYLAMPYLSLVTHAAWERFEFLIKHVGRFALLTLPFVRF